MRTCSIAGSVFSAIAVVAAVACGGSDSGDGGSTGTGASGGAASSAGGNSAATGGSNSATGGSAAATGGGSATGGSDTGAGGTGIPGGGTSLAGCPVFPADNAWNLDVSGAPVDPQSDTYMASMNAGSKKLHPDFGSDPTYGIPYVVVPGTQPKVPMTFDYADESDPGPYPFPADAPVEGGAGASGDRHVLVIDSGACKLYETFDSHFQSAATGWKCGSGAIWDLKTGALRPEGWTSADAAGLPIFPGLARRDETDAGEIRHALRFTVQSSQNGYVHPATHSAGKADPKLPPMGLRVRLKASYDTSKVTGASKVILTALKKYGMFVADNGSDWYISGATDTGWNDDDLGQLKQVPASAFEVVKLGTIVKQ
jgi:hypothetical protein